MSTIRTLNEILRRMRNELDAVVREINATPSGDARNALCDAQIKLFGVIESLELAITRLQA